MLVAGLPRDCVPMTPASTLTCEGHPGTWLGQPPQKAPGDTHRQHKRAVAGRPHHEARKTPTTSPRAVCRVDKTSACSISKAWESRAPTCPSWLLGQFWLSSSKWGYCDDYNTRVIHRMLLRTQGGWVSCVTVEGKMGWPFWKTLWQFLNKLNTHVPNYRARLLGLFPQKRKV